MGVVTGEERPRALRRVDVGCRPELSGPILADARDREAAGRLFVPKGISRIACPTDIRTDGGPIAHADGSWNATPVHRARPQMVREA